MNGKQLLEILGDALLVAFGAVLLAIFIPLLLRGAYYAVEQNPVILGAELGAGVLIIILGIERFRDDLRK